MSCPRTLPCQNQADNDAIRFVVLMDAPTVNYAPSFKMAHYRWFRVKWLSFQSPVSDFDALFLAVNSLGEGKQDTIFTSNNRYVPSSIYTISMPIKEGERVALDSSADPWSWIPLPEGVNLRNLQFQAFVNGLLPGSDKMANVVTPTNKVSFELEFRCSL